VDFEPDDRVVAVSGYVVAYYSVDQIGPYPSLQTSMQTAAKFTILHPNQTDRTAQFHEAGVVKFLPMQDATPRFIVPSLKRNCQLESERRNDGDCYSH
jgi:hypothetical protein